MKHLFRPLATALAATLQFAATAAVPVAWTNSPGMPPYPIKPVPHGSTVDLAVTLKGYTTPPIADGADVRLWYQTNGMGSAWWSAPATFDGSTITATFGPAQDCGADRVSLFFGAPSNVFASAVLRLTHAPGFVPNAITPPVLKLDFDALAVTNAPYYTKAETDAKIVELSPPTSLEPATNYTDGVASALLAVISRKADMYRYESGATSNVLVSCDWRLDTGRYFYTLREDEGLDDSWSFYPTSPSGAPRLGGTSYFLTYRDAAGWVLEYGNATPGSHMAYTNSQDRSSATLDFGAYVLTRTNEVWAAGTNRYPVVYRDELRGAITDVVTKPFVEGLGIESGLQKEEDPVWESEKSGYAKTDEVNELARAFETKVLKSVITNRTYNLIPDRRLGVVWKDDAVGGRFFARCYTNDLSVLEVEP